ncbi:MAG: hypothetical protein UT68_C0004G0094 [Parcubacteria group bacterium GW2011_GWC2_40_10]|nr:MAG: hypothetical protein UT25_C0002G0169 [Parcubacteria group bacterium GW2011_GWC1_39_12]KKR35286.1 MAG: hypothetical protein UT68_C0004G0094 [Parcubacteria group bacterium GW2011_GWC2_40_10]KKR66252.1 MAG: hypothetical protein UU06_C0003G0002 [Parcubacteria group bacterium GW2011_GWB1_40_5]
MTKSKRTKSNLDILPDRLEELQRATLIASTGASTRLAGSKIADKEVEQILNTVSGQK